MSRTDVAEQGRDADCDDVVFVNAGKGLFLCDPGLNVVDVALIHGDI
jgi:hypothetical protein